MASALKRLMTVSPIAFTGRVTCTCGGTSTTSLRTRIAFKCHKRNMSADWSYSPAQLKQLHDECIVVDEGDSVVGSATKKDCHLLGDNKIALLHRAFSVFIFNSKKELLLQQRAKSKITFPEYFTNSCCSHPRYTEDELEDSQGNRVGIKRAAIRRLNFELGIPVEEIDVSDLKFLTRVHYAAPADKRWGEHEIDYVLFLQKDVKLDVNSDEVKSVCYVDKNDLQEIMYKAHRKEIKVTPWFQFITEKFLPAWWDNLNDLDIFVQDTVIHRAPIVSNL